MAGKKTRSIEAEDFNQLQREGFQLENPQGEFNYQPSSSGTTGGEIGQQEYVIKSAAEDIPNAESIIDITDDPSVVVPGESQWSQDRRLPLEEYSDAAQTVYISDTTLAEMARDRLRKHPRLKPFKINVDVKNSQITVRGTVTSISARILADEILSALPGVRGLHDEISVREII